MKNDAKLNEKAIIERALTQMRSHQPGVPSEKVKLFLAKIGEVQERGGQICKDSVDELHRQLKNGQM